MNYKDLLRALSSIEDERNISKDIVIDALKEALTKAYRKNVELPDIYVKVDIDETTGKIHLYQQYKVVENVEDEELEISLEDARAINQNAQYDDFIDEEKPIDQLSRASATLARNVMKQKIREAQKSAIYDEYIDQLDEMVLGFIETVEEKFTLVNLGKTIAMMPKGAQIPNERLVEGQKTRVVITAVNKDTKGSQVLVSRADAKLVRRLFEKEVPEIYDGIVEIKAIAREAGERTKMAVYSNNPDVDPIGACIGQRGQRVQTIIDELCGEKIDIFEWSENITDLVKNALAPAEVLAVIPAEDNKGLTVVVDASQLSLAIGKKGKNARLAVKLTGHKIDIKTRQELDDLGVDYIALMREYEIVQEKERRERAAAELA
ncbi:MAG: transcription termination/antitermination protein NusA, partial [Erysipelotrichaceae bacterium]|nr:transcription termination/antitermination protein NusA [Erysipelotrichaceae bacterium]